MGGAEPAATFMAEALRRGVLTEADLGGTEPAVIAKLEEDAKTCRAWREFRALHRMRTGEAAPREKRRVIPAKKRWIDPLVAGRGRVSELDEEFRHDLQSFLAEPQDGWLCGE